MPEREPITRDLPFVDPEVFGALHDSFAADPQAFSKAITHLVKEDPRLVFGVFKEGHDRAKGDVSFEYGFAQGAFYALQGAEITHKLLVVDDKLSFSTPPIKTEPESSTKRRRFGRMSKVSLAFASLAAIRRTPKNRQLEI